MKKLIILALVLVANAAYADGPVYSYSVPGQDAQPRQMTADDWSTNVDGVSEDPNNPMSGTARAFRNGWVNRGQYDVAHPEELRVLKQRLANQQPNQVFDQARAQVAVQPPLPGNLDDNEQDVTPQVAQVPRQRGYAPYPQAAYVQSIPAQPPQQPVQYAAPTQYPEYDEQPQQYAPPPPPQYVQQQPQVVYVQPPPVYQPPQPRVVVQMPQVRPYGYRDWYYSHYGREYGGRGGLYIRGYYARY